MRFNQSFQYFVFFAALLIFVAAGCREASSPAGTNTAKSNRQVSVAAAADLKFALDELIEDFQKQQPDITVQVSYGSSGTFFAQLSNEAPFDLFFSADLTYPRRLVDNGLADRESILLYAIGQIVVWVPEESPIDVERLGIQSLLDPAATKIAIANPQHAPYGRAAEAALNHFGVLDKVRERLVFGENIAQTAQFVESGAADIGVIALSLALAPKFKDRGRFWQVPLDTYPQMEQGCVILNWAKDREAAERLRSYVASSNGRAILRRYGFILPAE